MRPHQLKSGFRLPTFNSPYIYVLAHRAALSNGAEVEKFGDELNKAIAPEGYFYIPFKMQFTLPEVWPSNYTGEKGVRQD